MHLKIDKKRIFNFSTESQTSKDEIVQHTSIKSCVHKLLFLTAVYSVKMKYYVIDIVPNPVWNLQL